MGGISASFICRGVRIGFSSVGIWNVFVSLRDVCWNIIVRFVSRGGSHHIPYLCELCRTNCLLVKGTDCKIIFAQIMDAIIFLYTEFSPSTPTFRHRMQRTHRIQ